MSINKHANRLSKAIIVISLWFSIPAFAQPVQINALFQSWSAIDSAQKKFVEEQFDPLLEISQKRYGQLSYQSPDRLEQRYDRPIKGLILFSPSLLKIDLPNRQMEINVAQFPELSLFSQTLLNLLNGNLEALKNTFTIEFKSQSNQTWQLNLVPKQTFLKQIQAVEIHGSQTDIESILLRQTSGDWRKLTLSTID